MGASRKIIQVAAIAVGVALIIAGILSVLFFQSLVNSIIASRLPLQENTETFELWRKPPATPILKVYFFNVTNTEEFINSNGTIKLVLQEFGPYTYSEKWEKINPVWHPNGTLSYQTNKLFYFEPTLSLGSEDDKYVLPNIPFLSALSSLKYSAGFSKKAVSTILDILKLTPFGERTVREMMWGYEDPLLKLGKQVLPEGKRVPFDKFGLFYGKNNTPSQVYTVFTGQEVLTDYARINVWNGKSRLSHWRNPNEVGGGRKCEEESEVRAEDEDNVGTNGGEEVKECVREERNDDYCNMINGTDGTGFPSMLNENSFVYLFQPDLCRSLKLKFKEHVKQQELPALRFVPSEDTFGDVETFPSNECWCTEGPPCARKGTFNISVCQFGSPVLISWPHFLNGDISLRQQIDGLHPDPARHQFYIDIQPKLGIPMQAKGRVQINIQMTRVHDIPAAAQLSDILIPVIWFEDGIEKLPESVTSLIRQAVFVPEVAELGLSIAFFGFGLLILICGLIFMAKSIYGKTVPETNGHGPPMKEEKNGVKNGKQASHKNGSNGLEMEDKKIIKSNGHDNPASETST